MSTRIGYNTSTSVLGSTLQTTISQLLHLKGQLGLLKDAMDSMASGGTYSVIESELGVDAGQGQTMYNLVAGAVTSLGGANFTELIRIFKG
jgi:hypothetical protein